ncbi:unnamed protein product, partial [Mesorhabditis belari]|uniref:Uncharacterized protein n=1 Tax=Mesorhabditis belari TaxID=2138241 RepID=A0AAF3J329_9BILA
MDFTKYGDTVNYSTFMNNMTELYKELFTTRNYNKALSPVFLNGGRKNATSNPLVIHFTLFYMKMFFLDAESQQLSLCIELVQGRKACLGSR